ncbi:MAG: tRNA pseudouridine(38-40) synthase TruA [Lachnospiraceae bacterium]
MKRVKLIVAYDGTNYCGWQVQPNGLAVQEVVNRCLSQLLREDISVIGASRTDAGVHALGNVCVFDTHSRMPAEKISLALNTYLPPDIRIQDSCQVPEDFHPRFQNTIKTYEYRIYNRKFPDPTKRLYTFFYYYPLDVEKMRRGAAYLVGEHDFRSFSTAKPGVDNTVRTIYSLEVSRSADDVITLRITGNGFLYNMVRIIAGTLIRVGGGACPPERVKEILEAKDRNLAGETARPEGLTLVQIRYPDWEKSICAKSDPRETAANSGENCGKT